MTSLTPKCDKVHSFAKMIKVYSISEKTVNFYMDGEGQIHWSYDGNGLAPLKALPQKLQIPFLIKFIHDHSLSEKLKFIEDPLISIEMYIKADFLRNGTMEMES